MPVFDQYARYYDLLYRDKDYRAETDFLLSLLAEHAPGEKSIFEMGCGTGIHACLLAQAGHRVHGIDSSQTMLAAADKRRAGLAAATAERLSFALGDVRTYRAGCTFDVALSVFHVFSYQTANADLQSAFDTASRHLDAGGLLVFDYWYGPAVLAQRPETRVKRLLDNDLTVLRIAEPRIDEQRNLVEVNYETHVSAGEAREVIRESHRMRYLFLPEIELLADSHGFRPVCHREWMGVAAPSTASWSAVSMFRKR